MPSIRRALAISLTWGLLWFTLLAVNLSAVIVRAPSNLDPGEAQLFVLIFGSMSLLSGIAFAIILSLAERTRTVLDLPFLRTMLWGFLATAIVQSFYLGHGDQGLLANIQMALIFSVFGGVVTAVWLLLARWWVRARPVRSAGHRLP
jgi:hypothetical protein